MVFITYYAYLLWQCYKVYVAVYFIFTFYGFSRMTLTVFWKLFKTVFTMSLNGFTNLYDGGCKENIDEWLLVNYNGVDGRGGEKGDGCGDNCIEMIAIDNKN